LKLKKIFTILLLGFSFLKCGDVTIKLYGKTNYSTYNSEIKDLPIYIGDSIDHPNSFSDGLFIDGLYKSQLGVELGYIYLEPKRPDFIKSVISNELEIAGFHILNSKNPKYPEIQLVVNQIFMETEPGIFAIGNVSVIDVNITISNSKKSFSRRFKSIDELNMPFFNNPSFLHASLLYNLKKFILKVIPEISDIYLKEFK